MRIKRQDIEKMIDDIAEGNTSEGGYSSLHPTIAFYLERLFIGSALHRWPKTFDIRNAEAWLYDGNNWPSGEEIAPIISPEELREMIDAPDDIEIEIID